MAGPTTITPALRSSRRLPPVPTTKNMQWTAWRFPYRCNTSSGGGMRFAHSLRAGLPCDMFKTRYCGANMGHLTHPMWWLVLAKPSPSACPEFRPGGVLQLQLERDLEPAGSTPRLNIATHTGPISPLLSRHLMWSSTPWPDLSCYDPREIN